MQNRRTTIFFALAILFGIAAALTAQQLLNRPAVAAQPARLETTQVVVARVDINTGTALLPNQLDAIDWPSSLVPKGAFSSKEKLKGRVLRHALAVGEPVSALALLPEGSQAGLVSVIAENQRAVSVKVDAIIGVAGFVNPGSRVDILATLRDGRSSKNSTSKVILQDVAVLAIDQKMEEVKNGEPELVSVVTLAVTPQQAEELTYSAHEGRLQLALRSPADRQIAKTSGVTASDLLPRRNRAVRRGAATSNVQVVKGTAVSVKAY
jgi:pilus assembly protein CpaB